MAAGAPYDDADLERRLAGYLSERSGTTVSVNEVRQRFYFYAFKDTYVLAIDARHPNGEKWLFVDGCWWHGERMKF